MKEFTSTEILLPDLKKCNGEQWSVVACDQYTSEPEYWQETARIVGTSPSTLHLMLPEIYLSEGAGRIPTIHAEMDKLLSDGLVAYPDAMIYLERTQADGRIRRGLVGAVDLEAYNYLPGSTSLIRATEGTVLERIPPRVAVRRGAALELPHVMLLIDDPAKTVIEPLAETYASAETVYNFDLMQNGGHVRGVLLPREEQERLRAALAELITPTAMQTRYGDASLPALLFAVGDGNHSLATAKAAYEEIKAAIGAERAAAHPARYALAEVVNLHDAALDFEPIYRVVFHAGEELLPALRSYLSSLGGKAAPQTLTVLRNGSRETLEIPHPEQQLAVGTLQKFLDAYLKEHPQAEIDYIHGVGSLEKLAATPDAIGFLFDGMGKDELFRTVIYDGALPRKTFSMGHAWDKRYYLECRRIK